LTREVESRNWCLSAIPLESLIRMMEAMSTSWRESCLIMKLSLSINLVALKNFSLWIRLPKIFKNF
jgi:hypothetical protein